ncbi:hypothetical protein [Methylobacterium haplocladii]|uniref:Uncharacterized protein n=1 Tax=Methylobacterium haplocladii TaxID=1176176 RepID=A0A512IQR7_9HYPH|nr:hypothetical protein [Methylobacterium haplocladii]GEP00031.1 hypothetical protein MHA02_24180 [Methylobacterium haplocladii]GJD85747.1 hypothetical protein HPGCJGGD_3639 [Methylobacterium haplocladii]GLS59867.1 hypothetical protein GCM10007887_25400 [Methylobacterium haplocladii]
MSTSKQSFHLFDLSAPLDPPLPICFDYEQLDDVAALDAKAVVERYRGRVKAYVIDTGLDLLGVKERLEHGLFAQWVESEMRITVRSAQYMMQAATQFGHISEIVSHLPPSTLYRLAAASTPAPIREEIVSRLEAGEAVTPRQIEAKLYQARKEAEQAKLTPEERKRQAKTKRDADARARRHAEKWRKEQDERLERKTGATNALAEILSPRLDEESYAAVYRLLGECDPWTLREALAKTRQP